MTRYRVLPHAFHDDDTGRWVAPFPAGPISRLSGIGPLVLDLLSEDDAPLGAAALTARLREAIDDAPAGSDAIVIDFCEELVEMGLVARLEDPP